MISVVTCSVDNARFAAMSANMDELLRGEPHEFIRISDARSICEGYNRGIQKCRGDVVILCHDDIEFLAEDFAARLLERIESYDLLGVCGSRRVTGPQWVQAGPPNIFGQMAIINQAENCYNVLMWGAPARCVDKIKVLDGVFLCARRRLLDQVRFDEATFQGFHLYDLDFTFRAFQRGFSLAVCNDLGLIHASAGDWNRAWETDGQRFIEKYRAHFDQIPNRWWSAALVKVATKSDALAVMTPDYWSRD